MAVKAKSIMQRDDELIAKGFSFEPTYSKSRIDGSMIANGKVHVFFKGKRITKEAVYQKRAREFAENYKPE